MTKKLKCGFITAAIFNTNIKGKKKTNCQGPLRPALFRYDTIAALIGRGRSEKKGGKKRRAFRRHQRVGLVADVEWQMRLGRIAR